MDRPTNQPTDRQNVLYSRVHATKKTLRNGWLILLLEKPPCLYASGGERLFSFCFCLRFNLCPSFEWITDCFARRSNSFSEFCGIFFFLNFFLLFLFWSKQKQKMRWIVATFFGKICQIVKNCDTWAHAWAIERELTQALVREENVNQRMDTVNKRGEIWTKLKVLSSRILSC